MARYIPVRNTIDAAQLVSILVHKLILRGAGVPSSIVSDRGPQFTSKFWSALCYHLRIKRRLSTAYHPQTDGQTERQNQTLEQYLRAYINYHQSDWSRWLVFAEFAYNNSVHASIGMTPLMAAEGRHAQMETAAPRPTSKLDGVDNPAATKWVESLLKTRREMVDRWKEATATQRAYADQGKQPKEYAVGDSVWLSAKNIRTKRPSKKLDLKYYGPFPITERIGKQAYRLKLGDSVGRIHPVFHVSLLEPCPTSVRASAQESGAQLEVEDEEQEWVVEDIRDSCVRSRELQYLVKWKGFPEEENTWEPVAHLGNSMELVEEFHQANPEKPNQATLEKALQEAAEKEASRKARAEAARQAKEARKRKAEEALAGRSKRRSERLQHRVGNASGGD